MKKKIIVMLSLVLGLLLCISLVACGKNKHEAKTEWKSDEKQHWHECATEGHDDKLDIGDHSWDEGKITTAPTEEAEGVKTFTCTICGYQKIESENKLDHTHKFDEKAWTSDETDHWHKSTCGHDVKKDKAAHNWDEGKITTAPTEEAEGVKTFTCTVCKKTKTQPVAKLEHKHTFDTSNWESDENGHWHKATCEHTSEKKDYEEHKGTWTTKTEADYGVNKVEERTCTVCKKYQERTIENSAKPAKENIITVGAIDFTYNGKNQTIDSLVDAKNKAGLTIRYKAAGAADFTETAPKNAGNYEYEITVPATVEWKQGKKTGSFTIKQYELTLPSNYFETSVSLINQETRTSDELYDFFEELEGTGLEEAILYTKTKCGAGRHSFRVDELEFKDKNFVLNDGGYESIEWLIKDDAPLSIDITKAMTSSEYAYLEATINGGTLSNGEFLFHISNYLYNHEVVGMTLIKRGSEINTATKGDVVRIRVAVNFMPGKWTDSTVFKGSKADFGAAGSGNVEYGENETKGFRIEIPQNEVEQSYIVGTLEGFEVTVYDNYGRKVAITDGKITVAAHTEAVTYTVVVKRTGTKTQFNAYIKLPEIIVNPLG